MIEKMKGILSIDKHMKHLHDQAHLINLEQLLTHGRSGNVNESEADHSGEDQTTSTPDACS